MLYLGRESGMNMEEENPIIQYSPRYGSYFTLKLAFRDVSIPGGFGDLQPATVKFLRRKQQARYICQEIHDSQLILFLFFFSASLAASPSYTYLPVNFTISRYAILPDSAVLSTLYL